MSFPRLIIHAAPGVTTFKSLELRIGHITTGLRGQNQMDTMMKKAAERTWHGEDVGIIQTYLRVSAKSRRVY